MDIAKHLIKQGPIDPDAMSISDAQALWAHHRTQNGYGPKAPLLTPPDANAKFHKTPAKVYGLSLAPDKASGHQACRYSTPECRSGCVAFAGHGEMPSVIRARISKTEFLRLQPQAFVTILGHEISKAADKHGDTLRVRLNTFSDLPWESIAPALFVTRVKFYDYTKWPMGSRLAPGNYKLTYSVSENTKESEARNLLAAGHNIAVVFDTLRGQELPSTCYGVPVVDGDLSDDRTYDPARVVVGLRAKGRMRKVSGNMVHLTTHNGGI